MYNFCKICTSFIYFSFCLNSYILKLPTFQTDDILWEWIEAYHDKIFKEEIKVASA